MNSASQVSRPGQTFYLRVQLCFASRLLKGLTYYEPKGPHAYCSHQEETGKESKTKTTKEQTTKENNKFLESMCQKWRMSDCTSVSAHPSSLWLQCWQHAEVECRWSVHNNFGIALTFYASGLLCRRNTLYTLPKNVTQTSLLNTLEKLFLCMIDDGVKLSQIQSSPKEQSATTPDHHPKEPYAM